MRGIGRVLKAMQSSVSKSATCQLSPRNPTLIQQFREVKQQANELELKDIKSGAKHQQRYRSYDTVEVVRLDEKLYKYLYTEGDQLHFMDPATYEQEAVDVQAFGDQHDFLVEDMEVTLSFHEGEVISGSLPSQVKLVVVSTEAILKGDQAAPQSKPAVVGSGRKIMVPQFVASGESILVDTRTATFVKRAK